MRFPLGELHQAGGTRTRRRGRPVRRRQGREPGPVLPGRHGPRALPRATWRPPRGRRGGARQLRTAARDAPRPASLHRRPAPQAGRGRRASRCSCSPRTPRSNVVVVGPRAELAAREVRRGGRRPVPARRAGGPSQAALPLARGARRGWTASLPAGPHTSLTVRLDDDAFGVAPGQVACLMAGEPRRRSRHDRGLAATRPRITPMAAPHVEGDPRRVPRTSSRSAITSCVPSGSLVPVLLRPVGAADDGRDAAAEAVLPGPGGPAAHAADLVPEVLPHHRHRAGRPDRAAPDLLRDARELLDRRLLQAGRGRVRLGAVDPGLRARSRSGSGSPSSRATRSSGSGPDEEAIECWRSVGVPGRADRAAGALGQLLAGRADRALRPVLGAVLRPRARLRRRRRPPRRRHGAVPRVLESGLHAEPAARGRLAHAAAEAQHRHRRGPRPGGRDPPGRPVGVRERPVPAAGGAGRGAVGPALRRRPGRHPRAARARRPRPRDDLPDRRRRRARRTRTAATSCAGSCAARSSRAARSASSRRSWGGSRTS